MTPTKPSYRPLYLTDEAREAWDSATPAWREAMTREFSDRIVDMWPRFKRDSDAAQLREELTR